MTTVNHYTVISATLSSCVFTKQELVCTNMEKSLEYECSPQHLSTCLANEAKKSNLLCMLEGAHSNRTCIFILTHITRPTSWPWWEGPRVTSLSITSCPILFKTYTKLCYTNSNHIVFISCFKQRWHSRLAKTRTEEYYPCYWDQE